LRGYHPAFRKAGGGLRADIRGNFRRVILVQYDTLALVLRIDTAPNIGSPTRIRRLTRRIEYVRVYVMNTKLTLRMDATIVRKAKRQAARRGKSVSQMFSEFVTSLEAAKDRRDLPPLTSSLLGIMGDAQVSEEDYKKHLREKYL